MDPEWAQMGPNGSKMCPKWARMRPDESKMGPNGSEHVQKLRKTCEIVEHITKFREIIAKNHEKC